MSDRFHKIRSVAHIWKARTIAEWAEVSGVGRHLMYERDDDQIAALVAEALKEPQCV